MNKNICFLIIKVNLIFNNDGKPFIFDDQMIDFINDQHFTWKVSNVFCKSFNSVLELIKLGSDNRTVGETKMNAASSRSHSIFAMTIYQNNMTTNVYFN